MAYEGNTNTSSYITAGIAGGQSLLSNLQASKTTDFTKLSNRIADSRNLQEQALIKGSLIKDKAKKNADALRAKGKAIKKAGEDSKPRMAGMLAAFALQGAGGYLAGRELKNQMNTKTDTSYYDEQWQKAKDSKLDTSDDAIKSHLEQLYSEFLEGKNDGTSPGGSGKKDTGAVAEPVTGATIKPSSGSTLKPVVAAGADFLTGRNLEIAKAIGDTEGGKWGYDAVNQGGTHGGYKAINSGSYTDLSGGTPLTSLSIAEVMQRQSGWNDRSITDAQWRASGKGKDSKIWAAGYFQFIPSTLSSVVKSSGIDVNRKFDKAAQQELFYHHARNVGSFQPWWGTHGKGYETKYADFFK